MGDIELRFKAGPAELLLKIRHGALALLAVVVLGLPPPAAVQASGGPAPHAGAGPAREGGHG